MQTLELGDRVASGRGSPVTGVVVQIDTEYQSSKDGRWHKHSMPMITVNLDEEWLNGADKLLIRKPLARWHLQKRAKRTT